MEKSRYSELAASILPLLEEAGRKIVTIYEANDFKVITKEDGSPVTVADHASHDLLFEALTKLTPHIPVISEEGDLDLEFGDAYWLVDPLDGTKGFIRRTGEFCINVALIEGGVPVLGLIHIPLTHETFVGYVGEVGFWVDARGARKSFPTGVELSALKAIVGQNTKGSLESQFLDRFEIESIGQMGSAIKFCELAKGARDIYIRYEPSCEWDTAAGQAIVESCGGLVLNLDKTPMGYGKDKFLNKGFIAIRHDSITW